MPAPVTRSAWAEDVEGAEDADNLANEDCNAAAPSGVKTDATGDTEDTGDIEPDGDENEDAFKEGMAAETGEEDRIGDAVRARAIASRRSPSGSETRFRTWNFFHALWFGSPRLRPGLMADCA
ncbi:hypothetical protein [Thalassospira marina]|uniref:Uncharacterized protein n=1 Tax=Thalassospira marina TaxID=2048283 RepID=A0ABM6QBY3_9PROT|nr:hypothetical protein [Thalassospira marina]AUG54065.1 hypothetical protein CSC3H3_16030 [Thalassospira marina]